MANLTIEQDKRRMIGYKFGMLTVVAFSGRNKWGQRLWRCRCECGNERDHCTSHVLRHVVNSCGCQQGVWNVTHGFTRGQEHGAPVSRIYQIWKNMRRRVLKPNNPKYRIYGARGITIDPSWSDFQTFYEDMKHGYENNLTLDRIDVNGPYCKSNCRWATLKQQANNKRTNRMITVGDETLTMTQWADRLGIDSRIIWSRINDLGWAPDRAATTPVIRRL